MLALSIIIAWIECIINICFLVALIEDQITLSIFNPIINYNEWTQFNWFGIIVMTLFLNIILFPYAIVYWIYKLFTVGRKEDKK